MRGFYRRATGRDQQKSLQEPGTNLEDSSSSNSNLSPPPARFKMGRKKTVKASLNNTSKDDLQNAPRTSPRTFLEGEHNQLPSERSQHRATLRRRRRRRNFIQFLLNFVIFWIIIAAAGLVAFSLWTGILLIVEPDSIVWMNQYLPTANQISPVQKNPPQTLEAIKADLNQKGFQAGELISFSPDILLPVVKTIPDCPANCQRIAELRLYQPLGNNMFAPGAKTLYQKKRQLVISDLEEAFVIAPLVSAGVSPPGTSKPLPFNSLFVDPQAPRPGVWLHLTGKRESVLYGQLIHYNPQQSYLSVMAEWTSPNGKLASWQQIHSNILPELIIDRSVGLEPSFRTYQIKSREFVLDPLWLVEVNLNKAAINLPAYQNALVLARQGLWSEALKILQTLKDKPSWSEEAQTQLELIQLHANITTAQAKTGWANPSQAILAHLVDGRWAEALDLLETIDNPIQMQEVVSLLKKDRGQLGERVRVTLQFNPKENNARLWGALIASTKEGKERAIAEIQSIDRFSVAEQSRFSVAEQSRLGIAEQSRNSKKVEANTLETPTQNISQPSNLSLRLNQYLKLLEKGK